MPKQADAKRVRLKPADPFDLIRLLARTQNDPRKAIAELVQNSIEAGARNAWIERRRLRSGCALSVEDDGEGVLPDMERPDALRHIATHIGHSRKLNLTPRERMERVIAGKYGIGLLGFWAVGRRMEMRSRVAGSRLWVLKLAEDEPFVELEERPAPIDAPATFTRVVIFDLHEQALRQLAGRKLADYLAVELRGPVLATGVHLEVHDRLARGLAQKRFTVTPRPFVGERLALPAEVPVPGYAPIRVELHLAPGVERPAIQLGCAGTLVADDLAELRALGLTDPPWTGRALSGLIDFPGFTVPPGTRRGVAPDAAATAFYHAIKDLEAAIEAELARLERERRAEVDRQLVQELRRALRGLQNRLPYYDLPPVASPSAGGAPAPAGAEVPPAREEPDEDGDEEPSLFPPGPLASVRIVPPEVRVAPGRERRVHALTADADGRTVREGVAFAWAVDHELLAVRGGGPRPALAASPDAPFGTEARLRVRASRDGTCAKAEAAVLVSPPGESAERGKEGIPEPELVEDPQGSWRSRHDGTRWEVNAGHEDYRSLRGDGRARFRYMLALLAKEIVQRSHGGPDTGELLERMVEILAHAERNLRG